MKLRLLVATILASCGPTTGTPGPVQTRPAEDPGGEPTQPQPAVVVPPDAAPAGDPVVLVSNARALVTLERHGLAAGPVAFGGGSDSIASFVEHPRWRSLMVQLGRDVRQQQAADPAAGVGMRHSHRLFDLSWLSSDKTRLELVGVVNRADRRPFAPEHCGETRLIYRLAYRTDIEGTPIDSRLPMTVNVVFWQDAQTGGCESVARRWIAPRDMSAEDLAGWLTRAGGPLEARYLGSYALKSIEVNAQIVRWPAVVHPSLGGHAVYVLRVLQPKPDGQLEAIALENVPDVARLSASPRLRNALLGWIRDPRTQRALDAGIAVMPERFASTLAISVTPRGLGRLGNRPFSQLYDAGDFDDLEFAGEHVKSAQGLLRRLDTLSCQGCHETRSVAGFHLLGEPRDPEAVLDTLKIATSPHLDGDLARRMAWVAGLAAGQAPDDARPLSDFERVLGKYGAHCGLGDPGFVDWRCADGYACIELDDPQMGTCLPAAARTAGDPCQFGELRTQARPSKDRVRNIQERPCASGAVCNQSAVGFPGGMCTKGCEDLQHSEACGAIVDLASFNACVARRKPFTKCIEKAAFEAGMRACDADDRCRDDYICARSPTSPQLGVCLPPYFLFQMRVDGHVL